MAFQPAFAATACLQLSLCFAGGNATVSPASARDPTAGGRAVIRHLHGNDASRWTIVRGPSSGSAGRSLGPVPESYSTPIAGNRDISPERMAVDALGNVYVTGTTWLIDPVSSQAVDGDVFVTKLDQTGHVAYTTYFGGDGLDAAHGIVVDDEGSVYVAGETASRNFPIIGAVQPVKGARRDAFVCKLNASGGFVFSTYLGGDSDDSAHAVAIDGGRNVYVTGSTSSTTFPVTPGALRTTGEQADSFRSPSDAFVTKISADGARLLYSTYLGGTHVTCNGGSHCLPAASHDSGEAIAVDAGGNAYVAGNTNSNDFPVTSGALQTDCGCTFDSSSAFISKLNPSGSGLIFSTYLGGTASISYVNAAAITALALGPTGDVYVTGSTGSQNFPVTPGAFLTTADALLVGDNVSFVTRLNASGSTPVYSTFLNGKGQGTGNAIRVDGDGSAYVTGTTALVESPPSPGAFSRGGGMFMKLSPDGSQLAYSTRLPDGFAGSDIALDANHAVYLLGPGSYVSRSSGVEAGYLLPPLLGVANAAGFQVTGRVAPGELVSLYGSDIGPDAPLGMQLDAQGNASTNLGGTEVLFDGTAAPLIYAQKDQINAVVPSIPYWNSPVTMQIMRDGSVLAQMEISTRAADPGVFHVPAQDGSVQPFAAAALNEDGTLNSTQNPARPGTVVSIFATGLGPTYPMMIDGQVTSTGLSQLNLPITVTLLGHVSTLEVQYAGQAPGLIAGVMQVNFRLPNLPVLGPWIYISLQVGALTPVDFNIAGAP